MYQTSTAGISSDHAQTQSADSTPVHSQKMIAYSEHIPVALENLDAKLIHLQALIEKNNSAKAYAYSQEILYQYEGNTAFDYYYGIAAIDSNDASNGVFALERVLVLNPDFHAARLELGRGYFLLGEYQRSQQEFDRVMAVKPPAAVASKIKRYLHKIRLQKGQYGTMIHYYLGGLFGNNNNVNVGPSDNIIFIPAFGQRTTLNKESQPQEDQFFSISAGVQVDSPLRLFPGWSYFINLDATLQQYVEASEYDSNDFSLAGGLQKSYTRDRYRFNLYTQYLTLDDQSYRDLIGINANWEHLLNQQSRFQAYINAAQIRYDDLPDRDIDSLSLGSGYSRSFDARLASTFSIKIYLGMDDAKEDNITAKATAEKKFYGLYLGNQITFNKQYLLAANLSYQHSKYADEDVLFNTVRVDEYIGLNISLHRFIGKHLVLTSNFHFTDNQSNIDIRTYERSQITIGLRYSR